MVILPYPETYFAATRKAIAETIKTAGQKDEKIPSVSVGEQSHCKHNKNKGFLIRILHLMQIEELWRQWIREIRTKHST